MPRKRKYIPSPKKRYKRLSQLGVKGRKKPRTETDPYNVGEASTSGVTISNSALLSTISLTMENESPRHRTDDDGEYIQRTTASNDTLAIPDSPRPSTSKEAMETVKSKEKVVELIPDGRRLVDIQHFFRSIRDLNEHKPFHCNFSDMILIKEIKKGLISSFIFKCNMCNIEKRIATENSPAENVTSLDINSASVLAAISIGSGHSQLSQQHAILNIPSFTSRQYSKYHELISQTILDTSWAAMEEAGKEELRLAREVGDVDADNNGLITVIADGAWSKRSYKVNYDASSGIACIVGDKTGKLLFVASRNKYCAICSRAETKNMPARDHYCYRNWQSSSTGMESDIVLEGFKSSIEMHQLKYVKLVGDGDSSVHKKLCAERPYGGNVRITKVECTNHLLRNYCTKLRELCGKRKSSAGQIVSPQLRNVLKGNIQRLRIAVRKAILYRRKEEKALEEQLSNLKSDISNSPRHVFGNHENCDNYFCTGGKEGEKNFIPDFVECGLMDDILSCGNRLQQNAFSLLLNMNNNAAECYNSVVAKFVGGKRVNFSIKNSYDTRCRAAAIQFNEHENYISKLHKKITKRSPGKYTKLYIEKMRKRRLYRAKRKQLFPSIRKKKSVSTAHPDEDYGAVEEESPAITERKREEVLRLISTSDVKELEIKTRGQCSNPLWKTERMYRLTASNFGAVCKLRKSTDPKKLAKRILSSGFSGSAATKWGIDHEPIAKKRFTERVGITEDVIECGLYVDPNFPHLGASPDGLLPGGDILEIKCPFSSRHMSPEEGVAKKKIKFLEKSSDGNYKLKRQDKYYNQVQGQLAISGADFCYFVVWTPFGILVDKIARDEEFWKNMLPKLNSFYYDVMIPEIIKNNF